MPSKPYKALKPMFQNNRWKLVRGDLVQLLAGKDKGRQGKVLKVIRDTRFPRVLVENCNIVKKHVKASNAAEQGFVVSIEEPVHYSNVALVDPVTGKPVRCQIKYLEDGTKVRVSKGMNASSSIIAKPTHKLKTTLHDAQVGPKDTPAAEVLKVTYDPSKNRPSFKLPPVRLPPQVRNFCSCSHQSREYHSTSTYSGSSSSISAAADSSPQCSEYSSEYQSTGTRGYGMDCGPGLYGARRNVDVSTAVSGYWSEVHAGRQVVAGMSAAAGQFWQQHRRTTWQYSSGKLVSQLRKLQLD